MKNVEIFQTKKYRDRKKILDQIKIQTETDLDVAEEALRRLIRERYFPAIKYILDKKGESRGYGNPLESITIEESSAIIKAINRKFLIKNN